MKIDINEALEQLAAAFNTSVDALYPILIKQAYVSAAQDILALVVLVTAFYLFYKRISVSKENYGGTIINQYQSRDDWLGENIGYVIMLIILGTVTLIYALVVIYTVPTVLLNPDYWVLERVLRAIPK